MFKESAKGFVKSWLLRQGFTIVRTPTLHLANLIRTVGVSTVIDIGANRGQFADSLRSSGYEGLICSFEPVSEAYVELERRARPDPRWETYQLALGTRAYETRINVASNGAASSSFLDLRQSHRLAAPDVHFTRKETVKVRRLDQVLSVSGPLALKLDTQGFELEVLQGADGVLPGTVLIHMEVSFVEVYSGALLFQDAMDYLGARDFVLAGIERGLTHLDFGQALQADATFVRADCLPVS